MINPKSHFSFYLLSLCILISNCSGGNPSSEDQVDSEPDKLLSVEELQADFIQFWDFIENSHPQLYRFTSAAAFDSLYEAQLARIKKDLSVQEFYPVLLPMIAKIGCGHTSIWTPSGYWDQAPGRMFPLGVYARDAELYVIHDYDQNTGPDPGGRIITINGMPAELILQEMLSNIWSDGMIETRRYRRLNDVFPYLFALNYGFPESFDLVIENGEVEQAYSLAPVPRSLLVRHREKQVRDGVIPIRDLELKIMSEDIAWMRIRTFGWYDNVKGFHHFLDSSFQVIRDQGIGNVIFDFRGNDGGDPWCSSHLLRYLQNEPTVYFMYPYGSYAPLNRPLDMADEPYTGRQFYLIDGMCFSTTGHLTSLLKYHELGIFIGEETGATYTCNDASQETTLKNSGYIVRSARRSFAAAVKGFPLDQGITPDYEVEPEISDVIENKDVVLEFTLDLIAGSQYYDGHLK